MAKGLKLKVRKFLWIIPTFAKVTEKELVRGGLLPSNLNRVKMTLVNCEVNFEYRSEDLK